MPEARVERETLTCPQCNLHLPPIRHASAHLDFCVECRGLWFDHEELDRIVGTDPTPSWPERLAGKSGKRNCPRDRIPMHEQQLSRETLIDRCPQCGGAWLDRGEVLQIRRQLGKGTATDQLKGLEARIEDAQRYWDETRAATEGQTARSSRSQWWFQLLFGLPVEVHNPLRSQPLATYALIAVNVFVFIGQIASPDLLIGVLGLVPSAFLHGLAPWTIITAMFAHGDWFHLLGNMYFLRVFGDNVEDRIGIKLYVLLYFLGGIVASLAHILIDPTSDLPMVGASGAISAVLGAYVYFFRERRIYTMILFHLVRVRALWYLGIYLLLQFVYALSGIPGVVWWAHIGGFAFGVAWAAVYRARMRTYISSIEAAYGK